MILSSTHISSQSLGRPGELVSRHSPKCAEWIGVEPLTFGIREKLLTARPSLLPLISGPSYFRPFQTDKHFKAKYSNSLPFYFVPPQKFKIWFLQFLPLLRRKLKGDKIWKEWDTLLLSTASTKVLQHILQNSTRIIFVNMWNVKKKSRLYWQWKKVKKLKQNQYTRILIRTFRWTWHWWLTVFQNMGSVGVYLVHI